MPLVLAVLLVGLFAPTASAGPKKPYAADVLTPSVAAGVTVDAYSIRLTNLATTQQLGSANITAPTPRAPADPAAFTLKGDATLDRAGSALVTGNVIELRNLALPPGEAVIVTFGVRMPCLAGAYEWRFIAKQSNDFSGTPGNDSGPIEGLRTTTVTDACVLEFVAQPRNTEKNEAIRNAPYAPTSGQVVTVQALDGSPDPRRLDWFEGTLTMDLEDTGYLGKLDPDGISERADQGLASFDMLEIDLAGFYILRATAPDFVFALSSQFTVADIADPCDATKCSTQLSGRRSTSTLTGAAGTDIGAVVLSLNIGPDPRCDGYTPPPGTDWYEFETTVARSKTIDVVYTRAAMRDFDAPHTALEICYAALTSFTVKGGGQAVDFDYDGDGPGEGGFIGLLPDCSDFPPPCVTDRSPLGGGTARISFAVPDVQNDPRFH